MSKPIFGKWTNVTQSAPIPERMGSAIVHITETEDSSEFITIGKYEFDEWLILETNDNVCLLENEIYGSVDKWMPLPKAGQDAFTELRARLEDWQEFTEQKLSGDTCTYLKALIGEIREMISE